MEEITIKNVLHSDFEKIVELCNRRYGTGYMTLESFNKLLKNPNFFKIATTNGKFMGFASFLADIDENVAKSMGLSELEIANISDGKPSVIYKSAALESEFEGCGVMRKLLGELIKQATNNNYGAIFASAWVIGDIVPIERNLKTFEFKYIANRSMLWCDDEGYNCIVCKGRCRCDAAIYYKKL